MPDSFFGWVMAVFAVVGAFNIIAMIIMTIALARAMRDDKRERCTCQSP